jgi:ubiquinone/menaquinone biosynthesis C-methylase UbiE
LKESSYDKIAKYYDRVLGDNYETEKYIKNKLKESGNIKSESHSKPEILELGCGTGNNLASLRKKYILTGIDSSSQMLKIAAKKMPDSEFHLSDIRDFRLGKRYDLILCLYDTINHLTLFSDWKKVFRNVSDHLKDNGLFVFDINTLHKLDFISEVSPLINRFHSDYLIVDVKRISRNVFNWNLKVFENKKENIFELTETNIKESSFEVEKITAELLKYFKIIKTEEENGRRFNRNSERIYFVCRKIKQN